MASAPDAADRDTAGVLYTVKYSDLDINGHFNSIKYMEAILDLFDMETYRTHTVSRFEIVYQAEARYGMNLLLLRKAVSDSEHLATICNEEKPICKAKITFKPDKKDSTIQ